MTSSKAKSTKRSATTKRKGGTPEGHFIPARKPVTAAHATVASVHARAVPVRTATSTPATQSTTWQQIWDFLRGPYPTLVSRGVLGIIFLLAGVSKELTAQTFMLEIAAYKILPAFIIPPMAYILPLVEILAAVYVLIGLQTKWAAAAIGGMTVVFIIAILSAMARKLGIECGCFGNVAGLGALKETVGWRKVWEDLLYVGMAVHLFFVPTKWSLDEIFARQQQGRRR